MKLIPKSFFTPERTAPFLARIVVGVDGGCWSMLGSKTRLGYSVFGKLAWLAHRVSWVIFEGEIPNGLHVLHHCDNPGCVNPDHLWLGTHADNMRDKISKGRGKNRSGEHHPMCRLSLNNVVEIRNLYFSGKMLQPAIAKAFSISQTHVSGIVRGKRWRNPEPEGGAIL